MSATRRAAVVCRPDRAAPPPGVDPQRWWPALLADVVELLDDLELLEMAVVVAPAAYADAVRAVVPWLAVRPHDGPRPELAALDALAEAGAGAGVVVAADAPDLPGLLVGKLFSGLAPTARPAHAIAVCPAAAGGLVALACALPAPRWLRSAGAEMDAADAVDRLRAAAPDRRSVVVGPGWHRLRAPGDVDGLDPGLEGWEATRALLAG